MKAFQNPAVDKAYNVINLVGFAVAAETRPDLAAHMEVSRHAGRNWKPEYFQHYVEVADIDTDSMDVVFDILNGYGDASKAKYVKRFRSMSVGDVIQNGADFYVVDNIGFTKIEVVA